MCGPVCGGRCEIACDDVSLQEGAPVFAEVSIGHVQACIDHPDSTWAPISQALVSWPRIPYHEHCWPRCVQAQDDGGSWAPAW